MVLSLLALGGYLGYAHHRQQPVFAKLGEDVRDGVILQTSGSSCAAAATANVLGVLGEKISEREMARLLKTTRSGTLSASVLVEVRRMGFFAERFMLDEGLWSEAPVPSVILVDHPATGPESHAVSLMGVDEGVFEVWDPLTGKLDLTRLELGKIWHGRGIHIWKAGEK
jgi:ABC-type bacteriocin/lantibiotic exporter with double-glycine peptidase domain